MLSSKRWKETVWSVACLLAWLPGTSTAAAQASGEIWGNFTVGWLQSERLTWEIDVEPRAAITVPAGQSKWVSLALVPEVQYALAKWVDAIGEVKSTYKPNGDDVVETKSRVGLYFQILSSAGESRGPARRRTRETSAASPGAVQSPAFRGRGQDPLDGGATTTRGGCAIARSSHFRSTARS